MRRNVVTWNRLGRRSRELFVNELGQVTHLGISYESFDTFISHKGDDMRLAEQVGDILNEKGVYGYLDKWDPEVDGDSPGLEIHIRDVIRETPSIIAVVTENTPLSWWVPFEIGVARETKSQIATFLWVNEYSSKVVVLPSYLKRWPILASNRELEMWAQELASSQSVNVGARSSRLEHAVNLSAGWGGGLRIDRLEQSGKVRFE